MEMVAPAGPMYQAGTLSGNPLAMTAGIKVCRLAHHETVQPQSASTPAWSTVALPANMTKRRRPFRRGGSFAVGMPRPAHTPVELIG